MATRINTGGRTLVPAPTPAAYPSTLLSVLEGRGLLHTAGEREINGVTWESDAQAADAGNTDVTYTDGSFASGDKVPTHNIAYTDGFQFEVMRFIELGVSGGTEAEQLARAERRFAAWESYDVARHIRAYFEANDTAVAGTYRPRGALARLLAAQSLVNPVAPMVFSGWGPAVELLKDESVDLIGGTYAPDPGFGIGDTTTGKVYTTGTVSVWRSTIEAHVVPNLPRNEFRALVERTYWVSVDGPIFSTTAEFADSVA